MDTHTPGESLIICPLVDKVRLRSCHFSLVLIQRAQKSHPYSLPPLSLTYFDQLPVPTVIAHCLLVLCYNFPTLFLSYIIVYLHFFGHLFFILVLLIYDYSSTVCLLRRLFMHCPCALIHAQPYCTVYKDRVDIIIL